MTTLEYLDAQAKSPFWQGMRTAMLDALDLQHGTTALDVGCGTGEDTRHMAAAAGSAVGTETDQARVDRGRNRHGPGHDAAPAPSTTPASSTPSPTPSPSPTPRSPPCEPTARSSTPATSARRQRS